MQTSPMSASNRSAARRQLIKLLAERLVRDALAEQHQEAGNHDNNKHPSGAVRALQHGQAERNVD
nr:hypothetical protein [uncultured Roseateles sp.]